MRCYLINLDRSPQRLERFLAISADLGIETVRIAAVDGRKLSEVQFARWTDCQLGSIPMIPDEVGCFLSHRAAWRAVAEGADEWAFIAEDDLHFGRSANIFFSNTDWVPSGADIVKAETFRQKRDFAAKATRTFCGHAIRRMPCQHSGAGGYFLRRPAAARLVALTEDICALADSILFEPKLGIGPQFNIYQIDPAICIQDRRLTGHPREGIPTTIGPPVVDDMARPPKPTGLAKLKREASRPFLQLGSHMKAMCQGLVFKAIPFSDD
jgi:glycosyl transferase family 25